MNRRRRAFTLLELQVAILVMAVGLMGILTLMVRQSRQVSHLEAWCRQDRTYYVVPQSNAWMRALGAPSDLNTAADTPAWTPPVAGPALFTVTLQSATRALDAQEASAQVALTAP